jgi:hypothetical protein
MNETPSPYDVWAAEEALKLVEEAMAPATKPAPSVPTSDAFSPFVRHFSKSFYIGTTSD